MLDTGYSMLDTGYSMLDTGYWILDARYWILDARYFSVQRTATNDQRLTVLCGLKGLLGISLSWGEEEEVSELFRAWGGEPAFFEVWFLGDLSDGH